MNVPEFIKKWEKVDLTETSASHQHFLDLCEFFDHPKPAAVDPTGESFTFEKGATKQDGSDGWADVWKCGFFGWEYKGKKKDLDRATNLYNERPTWLELAHKRLDDTVFSAYGWSPAITDEEILVRLLKLNQERAGRS